MAHKVSTVGQPIGFKVLGFFDKSRLGFSPKEIDLKGQKNEGTGTHYPFFYFTQSRVFWGVRQSWHWNFSSNIDPVFPLVFKHLRKR